MLLAEKANRRVRIADEKKDEYIGMGYTVKNMDGTVIKAPVDNKKRVQELEAELKKTREEVETASEARMDLLNSVGEENMALKAENVALKERLAKAAQYAGNADKRLAELEKKLNAESKLSRSSGTKKSETADKAPDAGNKEAEKEQA